MSSRNESPEGGHGAAFDSPEDLDSIARFLLGLEEPKRLGTGSAQKPFPGRLSRLSEGLWLVGMVSWSAATATVILDSGTNWGLRPVTASALAADASLAG
jgi:hypothetical protein